LGPGSQEIHQERSSSAEDRALFVFALILQRTSEMLTMPFASGFAGSDLD